MKKILFFLVLLSASIANAQKLDTVVYDYKADSTLMANQWVGNQPIPPDTFLLEDLFIEALDDTVFHEVQTYNGLITGSKYWISKELMDEKHFVLMIIGDKDTTFCYQDGTPIKGKMINCKILE